MALRRARVAESELEAAQGELGQFRASLQAQPRTITQASFRLPALQRLGPVSELVLDKTRDHMTHSLQTKGKRCLQFINLSLIC